MSRKNNFFLIGVLAAVGLSACASSAEPPAAAIETEAEETATAEANAAETTAAETTAAETTTAETTSAETTAAVAAADTAAETTSKTAASGDTTPANKKTEEEASADGVSAETSPAAEASEKTSSAEKVSEEKTSTEGASAETSSADKASAETSSPDETGEELPLDQWLEKDKERAYYDVLEGKTMNLLGDSYFSGHDLDPSQAWPELLAAKYGMSCVNQGISGSTVSNYVTTNHPMVDRYDTLPDNDPDIILIDGGRNDFLLDVPIGEDGSTDTATMKGALRTILEGLRQKYPAAKIICVTVWEVGGYKTNQLKLVCSDYGNAMLEVCEDMGIACINAMDIEDIGVDMTDMKFRNKYCENYRDVSHLNLEGMKLVLPRFEEHIAEICSEE